MKRGRIAVLLLVLAVAAAIVWGFLPRPVEVEAVPATPGRLEVSVEEEGRTRVKERYLISAPVAGYARRIGLKVGDAVHLGQRLAALEPARSEALDPRSRLEAQARIRAAEAGLAAAREQSRAAEAEAHLAGQELRRAESLGREGFYSPQAVEQAESRSRLTQANLEAARHAAEVARFELAAARSALASAVALQAGRPVETVEVLAPVAGRVLKVLHESEGAVAAGQPLVEIGNPDSLEVEVELLSTHAVRIGPGTRVRLDRWGGEGLLEGRVRVVEPTGFTKVSALGVEEQRVRVLVDIVTPPERWRRLGDGYRVEAAFVVWEGEGVLLIPGSALFRHADGWAVFTVADGRASQRVVRIGQRNGLQAQVLDGLQAGEPVVVHPDDKISDGVRVKETAG